MGEEINTSISKCAINKAYSTILWKMVVKIVYNTAQSCKKVEIAPTYKAQNGISMHIYGIKNGISRQKYC